MIYDRHQCIIDYLKSHNLATVDDLVKETGAPAATIRRDLIKLSENGSVYRVHGSVTLNNDSRNLNRVKSNSSYREEKIRIAKAAFNLIQSGDSMILDEGSTTLELARLLSHLSAKVITSDLNIGILLSEYDSVSVMITGVDLDNKTQSCTGDLST